MRAAKLSAIGAISGFLSSALGIGGGTITVPSLLMFLKYDVKKAVGTSLAVVSSSAAVGLISHMILNFRNVLAIPLAFLLIGSVTGAKVGAVLSDRIHELWLSRIFAALLMIVGLKLVGIVNFPTQQIMGMQYPWLILLGLFAGIVSALMGIGGGVIIVPCLTLFFGFSMHEAVATSLAVILPTALMGAYFHHDYGNIEKKDLKHMIPIGIAGGILGALTANRLQSDTLQIAFGAVIVLISIKILVDRCGLEIRGIQI